MIDQKIFNLSLNEIYKQLDSSNLGLTSNEAEKRLIKYGLNEINKTNNYRALKIFINQFKNPLIWFLLFAVITSFFIDEKIEAIIIFIILFLDSVIGFIQEYKAEKTISLLNKYIVKKSKVLRDNQIIEVETKKIVPGDIVYLNFGDIIPADIKLINLKNLTINEAILTGESEPVEKKINDKTELQDAQRPNNIINKDLVFMSTFVVTGTATGIVLKTGNNTYFASIINYIKEKSLITSFELNMLKFSNFLLKITLTMTFFIFIVNSILGKGLLESVIFSLALAIGITPELLPVIITFTLSKGALLMAKNKVIVKKLLSIENLGNMNILCCDKTGTLTEGKFTLTKYSDINGNQNEDILLYGLLCSSINLLQQKKIFNQQMDEALWQFVNDKNILEKYKNFKVLDKLEFDFSRRRLSCLIANENEKKIIVKGSPDTILKSCKFVLYNNQIIEINKIEQNIFDKINNYEMEGSRVIALAYKKTDSESIEIIDEKDLIFLGYLVFTDPPKKSAKESLEKIKSLGIEIKIITGDSPLITKRICKELGFIIHEDKVITNEILENLSENEAQEYYKKYNVFARINPEQKYKIVKSLNTEKNTVSFLGDGINDIPALKAADVGISVNSASDMTKETADVILLKKSLHVLADGIIEGRKAFANTIKYILNTTSSNFGNMITVAFWSIFLTYLPMLPSQILLTNLLTDITLIFLANDNVDTDFLIRPNKWDLKLITHFMITFGFISSIFDTMFIIPLRTIFLISKEKLQTSWFLFSVISENLITLSLRTRKLFFKSLPNILLVIFMFLTSFIAMLIPYTLVGKIFFQFTKIPLLSLFYILLVTIIYFVLVEIAKLYFFKKYNE